MAFCFPDTVALDEYESYRVNVMVVAEFYHISPVEVETLPENWFEDTLALIWAREQIQEDKNPS